MLLAAREFQVLTGRTENLNEEPEEELADVARSPRRLG